MEFRVRPGKDLEYLFVNSWKLFSSTSTVFSQRQAKITVVNGRTIEAFLPSNSVAVRENIWKEGMASSLHLTFGSALISLQDPMVLKV